MDDLTPPHWDLLRPEADTCLKCGKEFWPQPDDVILTRTDTRTGKRSVVGPVCKECRK